MGDRVEELPAVGLVKDQVSKDLAINVAILQQDFSAEGLYNAPVGRVPWLDNCGMKRVGWVIPETPATKKTPSDRGQTMGEPKAVSFKLRGGVENRESLKPAVERSLGRRDSRQMKNKQKSPKGKREQRQTMRSPRRQEDDGGRRGAWGSCCVQWLPFQLTVPGNDIYIDHSTAQLLEHLDDGALA